MPEVSISIPTMLRDCTGGERTVRLEATSAKDALRHLFERYPLLRVHLLEKDKLRPHLVILCDGNPIHPLEGDDLTFKQSQDIHIMQAVSGG